VAQKKKTQKKQSGVRRFYRETIAELRKVTWPTLAEARRLTSIVVVVIFLMAVFLTIFDYIFSELIALILRIA
jgi:preprotein translocase subunit SecE